MLPLFPGLLVVLKFKNSPGIGSRVAHFHVFQFPMAVDLRHTADFEFFDQFIVWPIVLRENGLPRFDVYPGTDARITRGIGPRVDTFEHFARTALSHLDLGLMDDSLSGPMEKFQTEIGEPEVGVRKRNHRLVAGDRLPN